MSNIKYRQLVDGRWHYWGYIDGCFIGPTTNQEPRQINCQFTGLHDVNGVEIYEGDILSEPVSPGGPEGYVYNNRVIKWISAGDGYNLYCPSAASEVIGNIYQTPELLEPKP